MSYSSANGISLRLSEAEPAWQALESNWAQEGIGAREGDMCEWRGTGVSLARPVLSLAHYFQAPATQAILNNNK